MSPDPKQALVDALAREHGGRLRRFLAQRLRHAAHDIPDLVQEVYLRLLRVPSSETIRSPRAYLFTVALHVLHQHKLKSLTRPEASGVDDALFELEARQGDEPASKAENLDDLETFDRILNELPPLLRTIFVLHRQYGYSRDEIAARLKLTPFAVKKYFAQALAHCRRRLQEIG